ncbi:MAG: hypothetical protein CL666_12725 [Balneola sp.]|nr:hypothetical protein [Balneola sp.]|tara:strand:+ start:125310 stop:126323 length:1014 start_codon:yes stop_codon:yes gene_type:complete
MSIHNSNAFHQLRLIIKSKVFWILPFLMVLLFGNISVAQEEPVSGEEVVFKSGDVVINGRLVLPDSAENVPVVIFMGGLYEWGDLHPQRESFIRENLEAVFPPAGIGVLYYDPRGIGESTGRWGRATTTDFAKDARAAIQYLSQRREVDTQRIGLVGMGEDGWVAQIVASDYPDEVKFVASLGTAPFNAYRQLVNEYHSDYICSGETEEVALQKAEQKALSHQNWVSWLPLTKSWRHMNNKRDFDPAPYIKKIEIPALFLFGENDGHVYSEWALQEFSEMYPDSIPSNFTLKTITGANRFFHVVDMCYEYPGEDEPVRLNFSFRFRELFQNWIFKNI